MAPTLTQLLTVIHISSAAVWFGMGMGSASRLRRAAQKGSAEVGQAVAEGLRTEKLAILFGIMTLMTGIGMIFSKYGGFQTSPRYIHVALLLVLIMIILEFVISFSAWANAQKISKAEGDSPDRFKTPIARLAMGSGVQQLLWIAVLYTMIVKF